MVIRQYLLPLFVVMSAVPLWAGMQLRLDGGVRDRDGVTILAQDNDYTLSVVCDGQAQKVAIEGVQDSDHFQIYRGGTSSNMQMINGHVQASVTYQYYMRPFDQGEYILGPATGTVNGVQEESDTVNVRVVSQEEYEKLAGRTQPGQGNLSCRLEVDNATVVVGEQAIVSVVLEDDGHPQERSLQPPSFGKLSFTPQGEPFAQQFVDNGQAKVRVMQKYAVSADEPGSYLIGPAVAHFMVPTQNGNDPFDALFGMQMRSIFGGGKKKSVRSNSLELEVIALPEHSQPVDGVGRFDSFVASAEQSVVELNEPFTIKLELTGKGNFDAIVAPQLRVKTDTNVYDSTSSFAPHKGQSGVGVKTFEYVVQIERDGEHIIPSQAFTFYNTATQEYESLESRPLTIRVKAARAASSSVAREPIEDEPLSYDDDHDELLEEDEELADEPVTPRSSGISWILFVLMLLVPALWLIRHRFRRLGFSLSERFGVTSQNKRDAVTVRHIVSSGDVEALHGFFIGVLSRYWAQPSEAIDATLIESWTTQWGWEQKQQKAFMAFIEQCEQAAFAPQLLTATAKKAVLAKAEYWHALLIQANKG